MSTPRITVLVRSIGRSTLAQALASLETQQLPLRVLVLQAGGAQPIVIEPQPHRAQVQVELIRPAQPLQRSAAANALLQQVQTEFALFLDDDDWLLPGHLVRLQEALDAHPEAPAAHAGVVCQTGDRTAPVDVHVYDDPAPWAAMQLANRLPIHAVLFRTAVVAAAPALRVDESLEQFEDWDFWLQLLARGGDFVHVPGVSAVYFIDAAVGSGHADAARPQRQRHLEAFGRRQLQRWQGRDVAGLIEFQGRLVGDLVQVKQRLAAKDDEFEQLRAARQRLLDEQAAARAEFEQLHEAHSALAARLVQLSDERLQLLHLRDSLQAERLALQQQLAAYRSEAELLAAVRLDHLRQIERLNGEVQALLNSTSWRITRPLRLLARGWTALRNGRLQTLAGNALLAVRQERRRHGTLGFLRRAPHYLRHAPRMTRVLSVRPPQAALGNPFEAPVRRRHEAPLRLHPELGPTPRTLDAKVSVVIPTLNAGPEFRPLLRKLFGQQGLREIEVVVVDSGSTDGTVALAREHGAVVVEIPPSEFSHSHARNLGARAAGGDWLLFMVQDAYPIGELWMHGMLSYLQDHAAQGVVAASCAEFSRSDSDLMYDCNVATHYRFLGCHETDRIGRFSGKDHMALRSQGQLSDVACMIGRPLFMSYGGYRGDYAEDLDLGIRLIQDGHQVAMLASVKVVHSHNRPPFYYLKRSFVDVIFLVGLFDDFHSPPCESLRGLIDGALRVAAGLASWLPVLEALPDGAAMNDEVEAWLKTLTDGPAAGDSFTIGDARFDGFVSALQQQAAALPAEGAAAQREARHFVDAFAARTRHLLQFSASVHGPADALLRGAMADALRKTLASTLGAALAFCHLDREAPALQGAPRQLIESLYAKLREGV